MGTRELFDDPVQVVGFLLPTVLMSVVFLYYPAVRAFGLSFYQATFGRSDAFAGLSNYARLLSSGDYLGSVVVSVGFACCVVGGVMVVALYLTFLIHEVDYGRGVYLVASIWPYALPPAVAGLVFLFLSHPTIGVVTTYVEALGIEVDWFSDGGQAFAVVVVAAVWKQIGYNVIFMTAAISAIPDSLTETARLDGVGPVRFLVNVLIPMSKGILVGVSVIMFVYAWNQYLWPLVVIDTEGQQVAQVGLNLLRGQASSGEVAWSMVMTGSVLTLLPPLLLLFAFRGALLETFTIQRK